MASIRIQRFAGLLPTVNAKELPNDHAQVANNCLLWDGWLRPMPQWVVDQTPNPGPPASLYKDEAQAKGYSTEYWLSDAVLNKVEPFASNNVAGIFARTGLGTKYLATYTAPNTYPVSLGIPVPTVSSLNFQITNFNVSSRPIARTYAVTYVSGNLEGPPRVFQQLGNFGSLFEGDLVTIDLGFNSAELTKYGITGIKLYRTIPGFDTAEELGNPIETGFHLVSFTGISPSSFSNTSIHLVDGFDSSNIPGDLLISDQWLPPPSDLSNNEPLYFGQTEGGWFVTARVNGVGSALGGAVQISERFMSHAWPMQNTVLIPDTITGMAIYYDNVFIGTKNVAYHISVELGETETLNLNVRPFINKYSCVPNSMVATNFGAMYASTDGLIALTHDSDAVATKHIASPGDDVYIPYRNTFIVPSKFTQVLHAAWWNGNYFGFFTQNGLGWAYVYNQPSPSNQEFPLGQLITLSTPFEFNPGVDSIVTGSGLFVIFGGSVYTLPLPGYGYDSTPKQNYTWMSKRFVMPGKTTFAGMKIVNTNNGNLTVTLYGYNEGSWSGASPSFVFTRQVSHSKPFRIPHNHSCLEWEIMVVGNATIEEIHLSTSYQDLIEEANG